MEVCPAACKQELATEAEDIMLNIKKLILYGLSVFMTGVISLNTSQAASVPNSSFINDNQSYQTAFLYFLPEYKDSEIDGDNDHNREYCRKQGYTHNYKNCASPRILKDRCPVGNHVPEVTVLPILIRHRPARR